MYTSFPFFKVFQRKKSVLKIFKNHYFKKFEIFDKIETWRIISFEPLAIL